MRNPSSLNWSLLLSLLIIGIGLSCGPESKNASIEEIAGNDQVRTFMEAFEGRGIMTDSSQVLPAAEALAQFRYPEDLKMDLILAEPQVHQPVDISFDHRGRLWVVQYNQYPYPKGVKVVDIDHHIRAVFDKIPEAPPSGVKGADKISIYEDTNQDGSYDKVTDAITGLNITTGLALGRGHIWVLSPPYLLAYPDPNEDGIPDDNPVVHLSGFGLEDTHAVANNLRWGPDGWLYGAQGSTTTANISSAVSKDVYFAGQAIWRYHPASKVFEVFSEGGGNTFDVEMDSKGRIYSGDNGVTRGFYYKQGGYYRKNWGKHGPLTNPYAFGFIPGMEVDGERRRFTHAWIKYEGASLPLAYHNQILAINPLLNFIMASELETVGSSFTAIDKGKILETDDHWFRPVDIKVGPDGGVYLADWNDSRLSHIDPRDTWNKTTGRIYRLRNKKAPKIEAVDLSQLSIQELIQTLSHPNKWHRQQALRIFGDRRDLAAIPLLKGLFETGNPQENLEALWAIHLSGGFDENMALAGLQHDDPYVRLWAARLAGDQNQASPAVARALENLAKEEQQLEVIGQLASTAKRLPASQAFPILAGLLANEYTQADRDNQLLIWWALEDKAEAKSASSLQLFESPAVWKNTLVSSFLLPRLTQRYMLAGGRNNFQRVVQLFQLAPADQYAAPLFEALQESLQGQNITDLPSELFQLLQQYQHKFGEGALALGLRQQDENAIQQALEVLAKPEASRGEQLSYLNIFGQINEPKVVPILLKLIRQPQYSDAIKIASLRTLQHYDMPSIGEVVVRAYPDKLRANPTVRLAALQLLASRAIWFQPFLTSITDSRQVKKEDVPLHIIRQFKLLADPKTDLKLNQIWPEVQIASAAQKKAEIKRIQSALETGVGQLGTGAVIYDQICGNCHQLNGDGGEIGPDLSGYDRQNLVEMALNIVDPNAYIREGYVNFQFNMKDGQTILGTIQNQTEKNYLIQVLGGEELTLSAKLIESAIPQEQSLMPEHLTATLSDQELRDLFAFIQQ